MNKSIAFAVGMALASVSVEAAVTCEGEWAPGCEVLTYNGIEAGTCTYRDAYDQECRSWILTSYGEEIARQRAAILPVCPKEMDLIELMDYANKVHSCKVPQDILKLVPRGSFAD
jgi:hypothetical protein